MIAPRLRGPLTHPADTFSPGCQGMKHLMWGSNGPQVFGGLHLLAEIKGRVLVGEAVPAPGPTQAPKLWAQHGEEKGELRRLTRHTL